MFDFNFNWEPEMETNIETIDIQHKQLFSYGRDIEQAIKIECIGVTEQQLIDIVCHLREYINYNTYEEEKIMEEMKYLKLEEHRATHNKFMKEIMQINVPELKVEPLKNLIALKDVIVSYIFSHILTEDIDMGKAYIVYKKEKEKTESRGQKKEKLKERTQEEKERERLFGYKICNLDVTEVYLYKNQTRDGELVAVFKGKVQKLTKLNALERSSYFSDIDRIGKIIEKTYQPDALDYIFFEDVDGRLNFHIIPKRKIEDDWGKPSLPLENVDTLQKQEYQDRIEKLKKILVY